MGTAGVQVGKEKEKFTVVCLYSPQNHEFGHFTLGTLSRDDDDIDENGT